MNDFFAYFAGYIDGDGHFRFKRFIQDGYECFTCKIMITSTDERPLIYFREQIGGAYYKKAKSNENWAQEFIYTLHIGKEKFNQIKALESFLIEKKSQFNLIEKFLTGNNKTKLAIISEAKIEREANIVTEEVFEIIKNCRHTRIPTKKDFIYLSGYIDAECCLTVTRKTLQKTNSISFSCHMRCSTTKHPCIEFIFKRFDGCISYKKSKIKGHSDCIEWQLTDKSLEKFLSKIHPFLINKREQCNQIMILRETYASRPFPRDRLFAQYYNHVTPIREQIYLSMKSLNKRGV